MIRPRENVVVRVGRGASVGSLEISGTVPAGGVEVVIGRHATIGAEVMIDLGWKRRSPLVDKDPTDPTMEAVDHARRVVIGHGAIVGSRAVLAAGAVVGNAGTVKPCQFVENLCFSYKELHAPCYDKYLSVITNRLGWWDALSDQLARALLDDRQNHRDLRVRILEAMANPSLRGRNWTTAQSVGEDLSAVAPRLALPRSWRGVVLCNGDVPLLFATCRAVLSEGRVTDVDEIWTRKSFDESPTTEAVVKIMSAFGIKVGFGWRPGCAAIDVELIEGGDLSQFASMARNLCTYSRGVGGSFVRSLDDTAEDELSGSPIVRAQIDPAE